MNTNTSIGTIAEKLFSADKVVLFPHINPDGDSVGACAALSLALRGAGVECSVYSDPAPKYLGFLNTEAFSCGRDDIKSPDLCVAVDCCEDNRLGARLDAFMSGAVRICIDHHEREAGYGDYYYIDPESASVCEIVYDILQAAGAEFTGDIANAVYTGIVTDTGGFRYSNTTVETHEKAAQLLKTGVDHTNIMVNLYNNRSLKKVRCESRAIERAVLFASGRGSISYLTSADMAMLDAHVEDADEIIDRLRDIEGVEMAAYLEEREDGVKVSMRSKTTSSVLDICVRNGGGGHAKAAGCTMDMTMEEAFALIKREMEEALAE